MLKKPKNEKTKTQAKANKKLKIYEKLKIAEKYFFSIFFLQY
ncbi:MULTISPECIES: hypothetical protein [unclassified Methanosarcina]|nr:MULTISPECIES: hypothetical protein [unclassified Methanosarcina]